MTNVVADSVRGADRECLTCGRRIATSSTDSTEETSEWQAGRFAEDPFRRILTSKSIRPDPTRSNQTEVSAPEEGSRCWKRLENKQWITLPTYLCLQSYSFQSLRRKVNEMKWISLTFPNFINLLSHWHFHDFCHSIFHSFCAEMNNILKSSF